MPCIPPIKFTHKVELFPGNKTDWHGILAQIMDDPTVKSLAIVTQNHSADYTVRWSFQKLEELVMKGTILDLAIDFEVSSVLTPVFDDEPEDPEII